MQSRGVFESCWAIVDVEAASEYCAIGPTSLSDVRFGVRLKTLEWNCGGIMNILEQYKLKIIKPTAMEPGDYYWKIVSVEHVPVGENGGKHNVYVDVYGLNGEELRNTDVKVFWGWDGQTAAEESPNVPLDKPAGEHMANIPMFWGQKIYVGVTSKQGYWREIICNLHTDHDDEGEGVTRGHHSFVLKFQLTVYIGSELVEGPTAIKQRLEAVIVELEKIIEAM